MSMVRPQFTVTQRLPVAVLLPLLRFPELFLVARNEHGDYAVFSLDTMPSHIFAAWLRQVVIAEHAYGVISRYLFRSWGTAEKWEVINALAESTSAATMARYLFESREDAARVVNASLETVKVKAVSFMLSEKESM